MNPKIAVYVIGFGFLMGLCVLVSLVFGYQGTGFAQVTVWVLIATAVVFVGALIKAGIDRATKAKKQK